MSDAISESTGKRYGLQRVCRAWERARSSVYARRQRSGKRREGETPARRGPRPKHSDAPDQAGDRDALGQAARRLIAHSATLQRAIRTYEAATNARHRPIDDASDLPF